MWNIWTLFRNNKLSYFCKSSKGNTSGVIFLSSGTSPWVSSYLLPMLFYPHVDHRVSLCQTPEHRHDVPPNTRHLHHSVAAVMNTIHTWVDMPIMLFPPYYKLILGISKGVEVPNERGTTPCVINVGTQTSLWESKTLEVHVHNLQFKTSSKQHLLCVKNKLQLNEFLTLIWNECAIKDLGKDAHGQ